MSARPKSAAKPGRTTESGREPRSRDVDVVCELTCEDPETILSLADSLGRLFADLWFAGKLDHLALGV